MLNVSEQDFARDLVVLLKAMTASPSIVAFIDEAIELRLVALGYWDDIEMTVTRTGRAFILMYSHAC
jgi:hypothetical protein